MSLPLIIIASSRKQSDTRKYLDQVFIEQQVILLDLLDYQVSAYNYENKYPLSDNFLEVANQITESEIIIFATPVYWYAMSAGMKVLFDRFTDLVTVQKHIGRKWKGKSVYLFSVGSDPLLPEGFEIPFRRTAEYFNMEFKQSFYICNKEGLTPDLKNQILNTFQHIQ